jgi:hypothetical protein
MAGEPFAASIDIYGTLDEVRAIADQHLRNRPYLVRQDGFARNGYEVHRIYFVSRADWVWLASLYFDAANRCQRCGSFDVVWQQGLAFTEVYCNACRLHRKYRPDCPGGRDAGSPRDPEFYDLAPNLLHPYSGPVEQVDDPRNLILIQVAGEFEGEPPSP